MTYDAPAKRPTEFLYNIMHDRSAPIADRVKAASVLMEIEPDGPPKPALVIQIQCISDDAMQMVSWWREWVAFCMEQQKFFHSLPAHERQEITQAVNRLMRCNELNTSELKPTSEVKGHG